MDVSRAGSGQSPQSVDLDDDDRPRVETERVDTPQPVSDVGQAADAGAGGETDLTDGSAPEPTRLSGEAVLRNRAELETQRLTGTEGQMQRARLEAALPTPANGAGAPLTIDALATGEPGAPTPLEAVEAPVELATDPDADYTRVDEYAASLAASAPGPTYHQGDYIDGVADALSGRVEGLEGLTDAERTRLLDHANTHLYASGNVEHGNRQMRGVLRGVDEDTRRFVADDFAARAGVFNERARAAEANPDIAPAQSDPLRTRAQFLATEAGLVNAGDPAAFLDRLGPEGASRFADALNIDQPRARGSTAEAVARHYFEASGDADPATRDAFENTLVSRATGRPTNPIAAEEWDRLSTLDPTTFGQADLRHTHELLTDHLPGGLGARVLGDDHPAVAASERLREMRPTIAARLETENAVYARAGFSDDQPFAAGSPEARAAFIEDAAGRIDTLSPRAADQALQALDLQAADGLPVDPELRTQLERRLMISSGQDLAARIDHQMNTALEDRGWAGRRWDDARNLFGAESGSEAVEGHLDRLAEARDALTALEGFEGTNAELSAELATRLDTLRGVAEDASTAVSGFIEEQGTLSTRTTGALQAIGGGLEVVAGAGLIAAPEPLTSAAGVGLVAIGADDVQAGLRRTFSGQDVPTFRAQLAEQAALAAGADPSVASGIGVAADLGPAGVSLARGLYRQAHRFFAGGTDAARLAHSAPLTDNFIDAAGRPRTATNAVRGRAFHGPAAEADIAALEAQGIRVNLQGDALLDARAGPGRGPLGGFNYETGEVILRQNPTYYEFFHESAHARQWLELGPDAYRQQHVLQREAHVFNEIRANADRFNRAELRHAQNYLQSIADDTAHELMQSGRFENGSAILAELRGMGVPEDVLRRIPRETIGYRPRRD